MHTGSPIAKPVKLWLLTGVIMVAFQIILGGITRLTGSGLSITRWEIVTGTIPPLNQKQWEQAFDLYKQTPQYEQINRNMTLHEFKWIYFWEYLHRLWARLMGLIFLFPFLWFMYRKLLPASLLKRLAIMIILACAAATFGWIMVKSGLNDKPWVNPYKLMVHLLLGFSVFAVLWDTWLHYSIPDSKLQFPATSMRRLSNSLIVLMGIQIALGGLMSGMKAGFIAPTWPLINGQVIPAELFLPHQWSLHSLKHYDTELFARLFVQFTHRLTAFSIFCITVLLFYKSFQLKNHSRLREATTLQFSTTILQIILGIVTVTHFKHELPVTLGVLHQAGAICLLATMFYTRNIITSSGKISP